MKPAANERLIRPMMKGAMALPLAMTLGMAAVMCVPD
jgi:hypothetical protein